MNDGIYRVGVVGASSLLGKELADELSESMFAASDVILLDDEAATGQMTAAGDEIAFIQQLGAESFEKMDFAFFAGDAAITKTSWKEAQNAGASIIDLTYALEGEKGGTVRAPWVEEVLTGGKAAPRLDLAITAVVSAHPAAVMLSLLAARLQAAMKVASLAATVLEPASEYGRLAMDELHQQTVNLLSFQTLPKDQYDAQVSFNLLPSLGDAAKISLACTERRIAAHYTVLSAERLPELMIQLVHAPVFHGYTASVLVELEESATVGQVEAALVGTHLDLVGGDSDAPSNLSAAGQEKILLRVTEAATGAANDLSARRFWLWLAADNLKLAAANAVACALEQRSLRPQGKVQ